MITMLSTKVSFFLALFVQGRVDSQLIGSRGVILLPDGVVYRDEETLQASLVAANFAKSFQASGAVESEQLRFAQKLLRPEPTSFATSMSNDASATGGELPDTEVFDFVDSRYLQPLAETRFNKGLDELEAEKIVNGGSTSSKNERLPLNPIRSLPPSSFSGASATFSAAPASFPAPPSATFTVGPSGSFRSQTIFTTMRPLVNFGPLSKPRPGFVSQIRK